MRGRWITLAQGAVSLGLVAALFWFMPEGTLAGLTRADPLWVGLAVLGFLGGQAVSAQRLYWLVRPVLGAATPGLTSGALFRATLLGTFVGTFLPLNVGGDVVKLAWLARRLGAGSGPVLLAGMLVERLSSVLTTLLFCMAVGSALSLELAPPGGDWLWKAALGAGAGAAAGLLALGWVWRSGTALARSLRESVIRAGQAMIWWRDHPGQILLCVGLSLGNLACGSLVILALAWAVGHSLTPLQALAAIGLTMLTTYLPISISGLGVMEAGLTGLLVFFAYPAAAALQVAVLFRLTVTLAVLPGAFFWRGR